MNRLSNQFDLMASDGRKGFIPFVTAGDPDLETSLAIILKLDEVGADIIELGVPFSDPVADGPTIQRSSQRSLASGTTLPKILELVTRVRVTSQVPMVLFSYLNPLLRYGFENLSRDAAAAGVDAMLITDVVDDEASAFSDVLANDGLDLISLVAPTTTDERIEKIAARSSGFIYVISRAGITGARSEISLEARITVQRCRRFTDLPIAVGFGISTPEQIGEVWQYADAAVVGSAIVAEIEAAEKADAVARVESLVHRLVPRFAKTGTEL